MPQELDAVCKGKHRSNQNQCSQTQIHLEQHTLQHTLFLLHPYALPPTSWLLSTPTPFLPADLPPPTPPPACNQPIDLNDAHVVDTWGVYCLLE